MKKCNSLMGVVGVLAAMMVAGSVTAGSLDPTNAPGPTMHTLEEIYQKVDAFVSPQTLSDTTTVLNSGYYVATNLTAVDTDLVAVNIKSNVTIFGVVGTMSTNAGGSSSSAAVPKTGQTTSYATGDDGEYQKGVTWPSPRFTVQADTNCVTDNLTGLVWARNANLGGLMTWAAAITYCEGLTYGGTNDWRLPNRKELDSLLDLGRSNPALPSGHPFTGVQSASYWSSSTIAVNAGFVWVVGLGDGYVNYDSKTFTYSVWPVRGGQ